MGKPDWRYRWRSHHASSKSAPARLDTDDPCSDELLLMRSDCSQHDTAQASSHVVVRRVCTALSVALLRLAKRCGGARVDARNRSQPRRSKSEHRIKQKRAQGLPWLLLSPALVLCCAGINRLCHPGSDIDIEQISTLHSGCRDQTDRLADTSPAFHFAVAR